LPKVFKGESNLSNLQEGFMMEATSRNFLMGCSFLVWLIEFWSDLKVTITRFIGKEMLMPTYPNATIIMVISLLNLCCLVSLNSWTLKFWFPLLPWNNNGEHIKLLRLLTFPSVDVVYFSFVLMMATCYLHKNCCKLLVAHVFWKAWQLQGKHCV
jgi:hypothetical protein